MATETAEEVASRVINEGVAANAAWNRAHPDGWAGTKSNINIEAVAAEERKLGRDLTYAEKRQLMDRLSKR